MDRQWHEIFTVLSDPAVSEVEANGPEEFFIKKDGKRLRLNIRYPDLESYYVGIENSLVPNVTSITGWDRNSYLFEGPLELNINGVDIQGRAHLVLPPAAASPQITIAKKSVALATLDDIAARGSMSLEMLNFLKMAVTYRLSIIISGGTGAGKTTMLEALTKYINKDARVGIAEDTPELNLTDHPNKTFLHSVPWQPGMDPNKVATLDWAVQQFQRMRTDLLLVGETRGKEFASFLVAANSGMDGSMTTLHATNSKSMLQKATNFALRGSEKQPVKSVNTDIANAINLIVQLGILPDGRHKVLEITEVTNVLANDDSSTISIEILYKYDPSNDTFVKEGTMTDDLRRTLLSRGANIQQFLSQPIGSVSQPEGVNRSIQNLNQNPLRNRGFGLQG